MHVITGGVYNCVEYGCMYDASYDVADLTKEEDGITLYGFYGLAFSHDERPAILWFDKDMQFVKGELRRCCANCDFVGRSGGGFFAECFDKGFQINDAVSGCCDNLHLVSVN